MPPKTYPHDRFLAATLLKLVPKGATPNQFTILRILMTPVVIWFLYVERYPVAIPLFLVASLTDMIDGSLARVRDKVTDWGIRWDPIADKLLIGAVALLMLKNGFPLPLAAVILGLEAALLLGGWYRGRHGKPVAANWWGKMKMLAQVMGVMLYLSYLLTGVVGLASAAYVTLSAACVLALVSLFRHSL